MATRVFYEDWQLQCCGDGFAVGDSVSWTAMPSNDTLLEQLGPTEGADIAWFEEHHQAKGARVQTIEGTVTSIRVIRQNYVRTDKVLVAIPGDVIAEDTLSATGWDANNATEADPERRFTGYVVTLS